MSLLNFEVSQDDVNIACESTNQQVVINGAVT